MDLADLRAGGNTSTFDADAHCPTCRTPVPYRDGERGHSRVSPVPALTSDNATLDENVMAVRVYIRIPNDHYIQAHRVVNCCGLDRWWLSVFGAYSGGARVCLPQYIFVCCGAIGKSLKVAIEAAHGALF